MDHDKQLETETKTVIRQIDRYLARNFGARCEEHETGCPICDAWAHRDALRKMACD